VNPNELLHEFVRILLVYVQNLIEFIMLFLHQICK